MGIPTRTTNVSIWCKQYFPQLLKGKKNIYLPQQLDIDEKEIKLHVPRRIQVGCRGWNDVLVSARITFSSLRESSRGHHCKKGPGWNDPMTAVVPRVKGFGCYGLSFSRHNKNIKMEHFFLYILSRYFI